MGHNMDTLDRLYIDHIHFGCSLGCNQYRVHMTAHSFGNQCFEVGILEFGWHNLVDLVEIFYILIRQNFWIQDTWRFGQYLNGFHILFRERLKFSVCEKAFTELESEIELLLMIPLPKDLSRNKFWKAAKIKVKPVRLVGVPLGGFSSVFSDVQFVVVPFGGRGQWGANRPDNIEPIWYRVDIICASWHKFLFWKFMALSAQISKISCWFWLGYYLLTF